MNKIAIFYHVYQAGDWVNVFQEQIMRMIHSGLFDAADYIHIGINGNKELPISEFSEKVNVVRNQQPQLVEAPTLKCLFDFCNNNENYNVVYTHTSGVSRSINTQNPNDVALYANKSLWRRYSDYFVLDNWRRCVDLLNHHDCVGTEWLDDGYIGGIHYPELQHYAGNIWWSKSDYIKTLDPNFIFNNEKFGRFASEFFIGSGNPNYFNFYSSGRNLYFNPIYEDEYRSCV